MSRLNMKMALSLVSIASLSRLERATWRLPSTALAQAASGARIMMLKGEEFLRGRSLTRSRKVAGGEDKELSRELEEAEGEPC